MLVVYTCEAEILISNTYEAEEKKLVSAGSWHEVGTSDSASCLISILLVNCEHQLDIPMQFTGRSLPKVSRFACGTCPQPFSLGFTRHESEAVGKPHSSLSED
ncbi:uncharacterized protein akap7 isoform X1 [Heptranchias perlo]|uniref:uncharacterized protein akap7 isoform X1 n=1 Tax=Heptranchias perlo TaxID=212740 RepID=UPI003559AD60